MTKIKNFLAGLFSKNNLFLGILVIAGLLILFQYLSNKRLVKQHKVELSETKENLQQEANIILNGNIELQLGLTMKTFVWAVRSAMMRDNLDEVDQYFNQLVKEEKVKEIILTGQNQEILVATNKKFETRPFSEFYENNLLLHEDTYLRRDSNIYSVSVPVLSLNTRLGTLVMVYEATPIDFNLASEDTGRN